MTAKPSDNMRIWDALGKTDPSHTKQFTRSGGFRGTAIKPMWANMQMTRFFGPCGIGWGQTEPIFQTIGTDGEVLVYCTVGLWYMNATIKCGPIFGVGGDKVLTQIFEKDRQGSKVKDEAGRFKTYPQTDDEAFKKAYTDALSNAMKFIGVGADVHMGLFDDSKYVASMRDEFEEQQKEAVFAEVERQKSVPIMTAKEAFTPLAATLLAEHRKQTADIPPELDWSYNEKTGVLICRPIEVKVAQTKAKKDYVAVKLNGKVGDKDFISYFHSSHQEELMRSAGKVCKFMVVPTKGGYFNIDMVLEIDGKHTESALLGDKPIGNAETQARLIASLLEWSEDRLMDTHVNWCDADWALTLADLKKEKAKHDAAMTEVGA